MSGGIVGRQVTVVGGSQEEEEKEEEKEGEEEDRCARARPPPATWQRATLAKHGSHSPPFHAFWSPCVLINQDQNNQNTGITLSLAGPISNFSIYKVLDSNTYFFRDVRYVLLRSYNIL